MTAEAAVHVGSVPMTSPADAYELRAAELAIWDGLLADLTPADWDRPTVCDAWTVGDIVRHLVAQAEEQVRPWLFLLRDRKATRAYPELPQLDAHMRFGAALHAGRSRQEVTERFRTLWTQANLVMRRRPAALRRMTFPSEDAHFGAFRLSLAEVYDVFLPRDLWMHRDDISQAVGRPLETGAHDRLVVEQVLRDLHARWSLRPVTLELTGPAGGTFDIGDGTPGTTVRLDAVEYLRALSGRAAAPAAAVVTGDRDVAALVTTARVPF
ncbi:maleylpyruvate isomerase family mycothiol-dependent enzyme [Planotetraspora kaengkrachanensis]|uniref:Maleylpyruvate isomerase family mycothiol-dependent enzyme n=1 Tax=Planotetraspora kaengkrachanensis TaxID=575193 RepID=A0A8J3Q199_9ACTN|nr:maleylpyruvate isomerase family mycothiol-dependent enzyme [Planotetraspora kaengkrachanensis]GIG85021.1 hypothetical protein Pka01_81480 [Planotetraspora kaengkrachanensis]